MRISVQFAARACHARRRACADTAECWPRTLLACAPAPAAPGSGIAFGPGLRRGKSSCAGPALELHCNRAGAFEGAPARSAYTSAALALQAAAGPGSGSGCSWPGRAGPLSARAVADASARRTGASLHADSPVTQACQARRARADRLKALAARAAFTRSCQRVHCHMVVICTSSRACQDLAHANSPACNLMTLWRHYHVCPQQRYHMGSISPHVPNTCLHAFHLPGAKCSSTSTDPQTQLATQVLSRAVHAHSMLHAELYLPVPECGGQAPLARPAKPPPGLGQPQRRSLRRSLIRRLGGRALPTRERAAPPCISECCPGPEWPCERPVARIADALSYNRRPSMQAWQPLSIIKQASGRFACCNASCIH